MWLTEKNDGDFLNILVQPMSPEPDMLEDAQQND